MKDHPLLKLLDGALSLLFPPRCEICNTLQEPVICPACWQTFSRISAPYCLCCGLPFDELARSADLCADCREEPPYFDLARAAGLYDGTLRRAIHLLKYSGVRALARPLGLLIAETLAPPDNLDCLCPVPLHPVRQRLRGYNQSLLLAEELGLHWGLPIRAGLLARIKNTTPQMQLPASERRQNVRGAFAADTQVDGLAVGLVDDVYTTGSTLHECSRILKHAGARRVMVITVARTLAPV